MPYFWLFATIGLNRASGSKTLLRNLIISFVILILVVAALLIITPLIANWLINNRDWDTTLYIMFVGFVITAFIFLLLYIRELAFIIEKRSILWLFYFGSYLFVKLFWEFGRKDTEKFDVISFGIEFWLIIILFIVFIRFKQIRKRTESDKIPWF